MMSPCIVILSVLTAWGAGFEAAGDDGIRGTDPPAEFPNQVPAPPDVADPWPAAEGFDEKGSDARAIEIVEESMQAMGGWAAWQGTRYVAFRYFGSRYHVWDRETDDLRIEYTEGESKSHVVILMNLKTRKGRAMKGGFEITDVAALAAFMKHGWEVWVEDSAWMFTPWRLKDAGVTLKHKGPATMADGCEAEVVAMLTGEGHITPGRKVDLYFSTETKRLEQWAVYEKATDERPATVSPWGNWRRFGAIMLSDERGRRKHTDVMVFRHLPGSVFDSPDPMDIPDLGRGD